jgi:hypothetical protein
MKPDEVFERLWHAERSTPADLRRAGLTVAVHNDYRQNGRSCTFWLFTVEHEGRTIALVGEALTDEEALDKIRAQWAKLTDRLHHAPLCPANHYHGARAPTGGCSCGAAAMAAGEPKS